MDINWNDLVRKYNEQKLSDDEFIRLEEGIALGHVDMNDLEEIKTFDENYRKAAFSDVRFPNNNGFDQLLNEIKSLETSDAKELKKMEPKQGLIKPFRSYELLKLAAVLFIGFAFGALVFNKGNNSQENIDQLAEEVSDLKYQMMTSMLEKKSAQERLKAVHLTSDMPQVDLKVANAMLNTLRHDENINVRLSALDVLINYADRPEVREGLIQSIHHQSSPLVQIRLAELMAFLQEKKSVEPLSRWMDKMDLTGQFKNEFQQHIQSIKSDQHEM